MKVLLIYPPDWQFLFAIIPNFTRQADSTRRFPPMGLLYIASYLMKNTDHEVAILDSQLDNLSYDAIEERIRAYNPDIVGITAYTFTLLDSLEIARRAKKVNPDIFVVMGGSHPTIYPAETAMLRYVDAAAIGDGEELMAELTDAIAKGRPLEEVPGLYLHGKEKAIATPPRPPIENLDSLPFPARQLLPKEAFTFATDLGKFSTTMVSSRGCKFRCTFCRPPIRTIRARSPENVVKEIMACMDMGIREINFYDDSFNYDEKRVEAICREIISRDLNIRFSIRARVDKTDRDTLNWLYKAGCRRINLGIEASDNETLRAVKKGITVEMARKAVQLAKEAGIEVTAYFMFGLPGQTKEGVYQTIKFAIEMEPDYAQFNYVALMPASELYAEALQKGVFNRDFFLEFARAPAQTGVMAYWENPLPLHDVIEFTKIAYRRFYLRPSYIWKQIIKLRSFNEFYRKLLSGGIVLAYSLVPWGTYRPPGVSKT